MKDSNKGFYKEMLNQNIQLCEAAIRQGLDPVSTGAASRGLTAFAEILYESWGIDRPDGTGAQLSLQDIGAWDDHCVVLDMPVRLNDNEYEVRATCTLSDLDVRVELIYRPAFTEPWPASTQILREMLTKKAQCYVHIAMQVVCEDIIASVFEDEADDDSEARYAEVGYVESDSVVLK